MDTRGERSLIAAILLQAVKDSKALKYQAEVEDFIDSEYFVWLWNQVNDDVIGLPDLQIVRQQISTGQVSLSRGAYH